MEMSHPSSRLPLPFSAAPTREGGGSPPSSSGETIMLSQPVVSCSMKPWLLSEMPSARAGWDPLAPRCCCTPPRPRGICGFVLHLRGKKRHFSVRVRTTALQGPCRISSSRQRRTGAGQGCRDALPAAGDLQHGISLPTGDFHVFSNYPRAYPVCPGAHLTLVSRGKEVHRLNSLHL